MIDALLVVGLACLAVAGFLVDLAAGFATVGVGCVMLARALTLQQRTASAKREERR